MGEEGHVRDGEVWQPAILHVTRDGVVTGVIAVSAGVSDHAATGKTGLRDNQGFESLDASRPAAA